MTPRAIIKAIKQTLLYFDENKDQILARGEEEAALQGEES